jgi:peroxiredoxin
MDYHIIRDDVEHFGDFEETVKEFIAGGWEPLGGVAINNEIMCQTMVNRTINVRVQIKDDGSADFMKRVGETK